ncbi:hypothetical protein HPB50_027021 [Hyalomma asiaticum]|uniref:Uncharacterized protein n=1 Tax=Hyalomma asiaticum TaxID=266040 RepID=A0ACB7RRY8_HYAAI|nr:hypothetical protein HPB50_027021 [Hyalomma asiaticum]
MPEVRQPYFVVRTRRVSPVGGIDELDGQQSSFRTSAPKRLPNCPSRKGIVCKDAVYKQKQAGDYYRHPGARNLPSLRTESNHHHHMSSSHCCQFPFGKLILPTRRNQNSRQDGPLWSETAVTVRHGHVVAGMLSHQI